MSTRIRAYDRSGNRIGKPLPWAGLRRSVVHNAVPSIDFSVPRSLLQTGQLADEVYLRVEVDGTESPDWYLLDDDGDDAADDGGAARPVSIGGRGVAAILEWAEVYPFDHVPGGGVAGLDPTYPFANATPGKIMADLVAKAKNRGVFPHLTLGFSATQDSAGVAWPTTYSETYSTGDTLLKVLESMAADGWCDFRMVGFRLDLYVPNGTLAADRPDVVLRLGREVRSGPRKRTRRSVRSVLLAGGDEGALVEVSDSAATTRYGRREGYESRGGITDTGTLTAVSQTSLSRQTDASESITLDVEPSVAPVLPRPGTYVRYDQRRTSSQALEPLRLQSVAWDHGADGVSLSVELADRWVDNDVRLARRIDALLGGSSANERVPQPKPQVDDDGIAPAAPASVAATASVYYPDRSGPLPSRVPAAAVTISWPAVTENSDGTPYNDAGQYVVSVLLPSRANAQWGAERIVRTNAAFLSGFVFGEQLQARVCTEDQNGNRSPWTTSPSIALTAPAGPIPQAPDPSVSTRLGMVNATWGGRDRSGAALNPWVVGAEVHMATSSSFTVSDSTRVDTLSSAGTAVIPGAPLSTDQWVRLVLVDVLGNRGAPSNAVKVTPLPVVSDDILDGAVGSLQLADLAVTTAKIGALAVTDAKIGSLDAGKITSGSLNAEVVLAGLIRTAAAPNARIEISSGGFTSYNASNVAVVQFDTNGNATFSGTVTAAEVTSYLRTVYGSAQLIIRPDAFSQPDGTIVPAILMSLGQSGERGPAIIGTYSEYLDGSRRYVSTYLQSPTSFGSGSTDQNSYVKITTVASPSAPTTADQIAASITFGLGGRNTMQMVPNLTTAANLSAPGLRFLGTNPVGLRGLDGYVDVVNGTGSAWASIRAAGYLTQSARAVKTAITEPSVDALELIRANPALEWEYLPEVSEDGRRHLGPMADDLPDLLVDRRADGQQWLENGSVLGLLWQAAAELARRTEAIAA